MLTYFIPSSTNLLLYYTTFSLITPRDYTLPHPTICCLMLTCSSLLDAILSRPPMNGCRECRLAEGKRVYGKWGTIVAANDVLLQEVVEIKAMGVRCSGRTKLWEGTAPTFLVQYRDNPNILLRTAAASCNVVDTAFLAQGHSMLGLEGGEVDIGTVLSQRHSLGGHQGNGGEDVTNTKPMAQGQSKGVCGHGVTSNDVNTKPLAPGQSKGVCGHDATSNDVNTKSLAPGQSKGVCGQDVTSKYVNTKPLAQGQSKGACGTVDELNKYLVLVQAGGGGPVWWPAQQGGGGGAGDGPLIQG